jgi:hypothetical protein
MHARRIPKPLAETPRLFKNPTVDVSILRSKRSSRESPPRIATARRIRGRRLGPNSGSAALRDEHVGIEGALFTLSEAKGQRSPREARAREGSVDPFAGRRW